MMEKDSKEYQYMQDIQKQLEQEGKYIATEENIFKPILDGFKGTIDQKLKAMQFLTGFIGR
jgi:hypothetical protein